MTRDVLGIMGSNLGGGTSESTDEIDAGVLVISVGVGGVIGTGVLVVDIERGVFADAGTGGTKVKVDDDAGVGGVNTNFAPSPLRGVEFGSIAGVTGAGASAARSLGFGLSESFGLPFSFEGGRELNHDDFLDEALRATPVTSGSGLDVGKGIG